MDKQKSACENETKTTTLKDECKVKRESFEVRKDSQKSIKSESESTKQKINVGGGDSKENKENEINQSNSPKVPRKFINNWKQACDRTKDRTKELLKKWRTIPEPGQEPLAVDEDEPSGGSATGSTGHNWSEHVWNFREGEHELLEKENEATWVKRYPSGEDTSNIKSINLTNVQRQKFTSFFTLLLDLDRDDTISPCDFDALSERLRHFADWSRNSTEFHRLREVQWGFVKMFFTPENFEPSSYALESLSSKFSKEQRSLEQWLQTWSQLLEETKCFQRLPLWLQYLPKILFQVINRSGSGIISKEELSGFFSSVLGLTTAQVGERIDEAYRVLTSHGDHKLQYSVYRLCFANFIFARFPNGPGEYIFASNTNFQDTTFPIDYKAMCAPPNELEQYSPELKSNRRSVIV